MGGANWVSAAQGIEVAWGYTPPTVDMGRWKHTLTVMVTGDGQYGDANVEFFIDTRLSTPTIALDKHDTGTGDDMTTAPDRPYSAEYRPGCCQR